jgi:cytochrome c5
MTLKLRFAGFLLGALVALGLGAAASSNKDAPKDAGASAAPATSTQDENLRFEGERRFRANCGRCHAAPPKFPPRMMATIVRHMRVRATITEDDMRLILRYMAE